MEKNIEQKYADILLDLYKTEGLSIKWGSSTFAIRFNERNINEQIDKFLRESNHLSEFIEYLNDVMSLIFSIIDNKHNDKLINDTKYTVANKILDFDDELKAHLYLKQHCVVNCYRNLDFEIINYIPPIDFKIKKGKYINSIILKIYSEFEEKEKQISLQISKRDLKDIIETLQILEKKLT